MEDKIVEQISTMVSKRVERFTRLAKDLASAADDLKELKYQVQQYDAKVQTFSNQILAKKAEIEVLDETIRRRKIEAAASNSNSARGGKCRR